MKTQTIIIDPNEKPPERAPAPNRPVGRSRPPPPPAPERRYLENTRAFPALAQPVPANGIRCSFCEQEGHRPSAGQRYTTVIQRRRRLEEQGRCLRCLRQDHVTRDCSRQDRCSKCQANDHHFLLCPSIDPPGRTNHRQENRERNGNASHNVNRATGAKAEPVRPRAPPTTTALLMCDEGENIPEALCAAAFDPLPIDSGNFPVTNTTRVAHLMTQTLKHLCNN
ncbi:hypothetical protein niasHT_002353 [Heterodera trifolii]|uniref:CCHC-type domain-containing protein n=1 Tax=Heterodera trifolii TaxID=157864 RepID=A0ABD2LM06_9BILA